MMRYVWRLAAVVAVATLAVPPRVDGLVGAECEDARIQRAQLVLRALVGIARGSFVGDRPPRGGTARVATATTAASLHT